MKNMWREVIALAMAFALFPVARADTFDFTVATPPANLGLFGSGVLVGTSNGAGAYDITDGSGIFNGFSATLVADPTLGGAMAHTDAKGADGWDFTYDNVLPVDDTGGLLFQLSTGSLLEIWSIGATDYYNELVDTNGSYSWLLPNDEVSPYGDPITMNGDS